MLLEMNLFTLKKDKKLQYKPINLAENTIKIKKDKFK